MRLGKLLDLAGLLEEYAPHARSHGYHSAAEWAVALGEIVTTEVKCLERASVEAQKVVENA